MRLGFHRSKQLLWRLGNCAPSRIRSHKRVGAGTPHLHVKLRLPTGRALRALFCTRVLVANARPIGRRASEQMGPTSDANSPVGLDNGREYSVFGECSDPSRRILRQAHYPHGPLYIPTRAVWGVQTNGTFMQIAFDVQVATHAHATTRIEFGFLW